CGVLFEVASGAFATASAPHVAIQLRQWAADERSFRQSIEYSGERHPSARDVLALERIFVSLAGAQSYCSIARHLVVDRRRAATEVTGWQSRPRKLPW